MLGRTVAVRTRDLPLCPSPVTENGILPLQRRLVIFRSFFYQLSLEGLVQLRVRDPIRVAYTHISKQCSLKQKHRWD